MKDGIKYVLVQIMTDASIIDEKTGETFQELTVQGIIPKSVREKEVVWIINSDERDNSSNGFKTVVIQAGYVAEDKLQ